jgi:hypothetical protein
VTFANPLSWWAICLVFGAAAALSWYAYRAFPATGSVRSALTGLRFLSLILIVIVLMRPVERTAEADARDALVPILIDVSRSMGIEDVDSGRRIDRARAFVIDDLLPKLRNKLQSEVFTFGESLQPADPASLSATARRSDLSGALAQVRERFRGRPVAGIVLISDGGDTGSPSAQAAQGGPAIFPIGVGSPSIRSDLEVLSVTAAEAVLDGSRIDLAVSAVSHGHGTEPFDLRLIENGRVLEVRRVAPADDGSPIHETFQVTPASGVATIYTIEIPQGADELVPENNTRSALVQPPARPRRILLVEGAPGYEHTFLKRALGIDKGLEVDSVVRKGRNEQGRNTYYIQATQARSAALRDGYPPRVEDLFRYDAMASS